MLLAVANGAAILLLLLPIVVLATLTAQWFSLMRMPAQERDQMSTPRWMLHGYSVLAIWIAVTLAGVAGLMLA